ncbi:MAG: aldehyde dehydrogenase family protein [Gammaproteobacteria bacterium]|nr:aldehyde dehydrogenase family protein [Gammaproteobacteria bacterium]
MANFCYKKAFLNILVPPRMFRFCPFSPVIVDGDCDIGVAGKRIAWGKFMSCGQTCLAPDHVLCVDEVRDQLLVAIRQALRQFYGEDPQNPQTDYSRIISERHFE